MEQNQEILFTETGVTIDTLSVITGTGNKLDFTFQLQELNLFESVFTNCMSGNVLLEDTYNLIEKQPICGQEWLFVRISKPGVESESGKQIKIAKLFRIYKVEKVQPANERLQTYIMHFVNEDMVEATKQLISRSYTLVKPELVIKNILKEAFDYEDSDMVEVDSDYFDNSPPDNEAFEQSQASYSVVIPNYKPFEAINFMAARARNEQGMSDYVFFENSNGYRFASLGTLMTKDPIMSIKYKVKNVIKTEGEDSIDPYGNLQSPIAMSIDVLFDTLSGYSKGEFGVQSDFFDISRQKYHSNPITYDVFLSKYKRSSEVSLNKFGKIPTNDWGEIPERGEEVAFQRILNIIPRYGNMDIVDSYSESQATRMMQVSALTQQRIKLQMPGTAILRAGRTIDLKYPKIESKQFTGEDFNDPSDILDRYLAAKYLIVSVRHKITLKTWDSYLDISKDTLPNELPEHFGQNYVLEGI